MNYDFEAPHPPPSIPGGGGGGGSDSPKRSARIIFPHRVQRPNHTAISTGELKGDVALTSLTTISASANAIAQQALNPAAPPAVTMMGANSSASANGGAQQQRAHSSMAGGGGGIVFDNTHLSATQNSSTVVGSTGPGVNNPTARVSSAVNVFRARVAEASQIGGGSQVSSSKLISNRAAAEFTPSTNWFNDKRYHPTNVTLNPLLQEKQLQELKEAMYAPPKRKKSVAAAPPPAPTSPSAEGGESGGDNASAFLTSTNLLDSSAKPGVGGQTPPASAKGKKKNNSQNTSLLNGKIGLRRLPNSDIALNDVFAAHSVALKPPEAPFYGGAITTEGGKKGKRLSAAGQPVMITTANIGKELPNPTKKKKGPVAPLISNIAAIHRGLAPSVDAATGQIGLSSISTFLQSLVPPEHEANATQTYIRPFLKKCVDDLILLQNTAGGSAVAGNAGADAEDLLNQTSVSGTTETQSNADYDAASTVGGRSVRATSRAGTVRVPSVADGSTVAPTNASMAGGSRAASPANTILTTNQRHGAPSTIGRNNNINAANSLQQQQLLQQQQKAARERQEELFFASTKVPYSHIVACFEALLAPPQPVSNMIPDDISGALLSARVCFQLCDPLNRGYITKESIKAMRSDVATEEDYNFNVVQGLTRAMGIVEKLEEERYAMIAKKARKGKNSKKPVPMPTVRQFHISLDEFTHLMSSDAYLPLSFLPYILKTLMNGKRDEVAGQRITFYGKSQVAYPALQRANFREKRAGEAAMEQGIDLDNMSAEEIAAVLEKRQYPPIVSTLSHPDEIGGVGIGSGGGSPLGGDISTLGGAGPSSSSASGAAAMMGSSGVMVSPSPSGVPNGRLSVSSPAVA